MQLESEPRPPRHHAQREGTGKTAGAMRWDDLHQLAPQWQLRSGIAHDRSPVPADRRTTSPSRLGSGLVQRWRGLPRLTVTSRWIWG